jgi:hypothetical protein
MADLTKATDTVPTGEPGRRSAMLDEQWGIGPKLHGGYLVAVLARAGIEVATVRRPTHSVAQSLTATFLHAPDPGPAALTVDVLRSGRGASQVRVGLEQDGELCVEGTLVLGTVPEPDPVRDLSPEPIALTPRQDCPRSPADGADGRGTLPLMEVVDTRLDPRTTGFLTGRPSGEGRISGWVALASGDAWTPLGVLVALDVLPPATFDLGVYGWSPTMSLTAHVHAVPSPGPLRATQWVDHAGADRMTESCRLWDETGRLVGQAHQLAAIRR